VKKPFQLVGPSGTGKTRIGECFIQNFANADVNAILDAKGKWDDAAIEKIAGQKREPILRVQNYDGILKEELVGEWNAIKMLFAEKGENIFDASKYFRVGALTRGLDDPEKYGAIGEKSTYAGRGVLLDEITRAPAETMNVYLQPLRERTITVEGVCFGECKRTIKRPRAYWIATANEKDEGTGTLPSALQTRLSREPVSFIEPQEEEKIVKGTLEKVGASENVLKYALNKNTGVVCLTRFFRETKPLSVKPNITDTKNLAETFNNLQLTDERLNSPTLGPRLRNEAARVFTSILGKNEEDAKRVLGDAKSTGFRSTGGVCGITSS
jgi:MoxR-like ATPase